MKIKSLKKILKKMKKAGIEDMVEGVEMTFNGFSTTLSEILESEIEEGVIEMHASSHTIEPMFINPGMAEAIQNIWAVKQQFEADIQKACGVDPDSMGTESSVGQVSSYKSRQDILNMASAAVTTDRQKTHGAPEDSFKRVANLWNGYLDGHEGPLSSVDVSVMLALLKVARIAKSPDHVDNWADLAGYAACGGELAANQMSPRNDRTAQPDREEA